VTVAMYQGKSAEEVRHVVFLDMGCNDHSSGMAQRYCKIYGRAASSL
jgi:hypothetical protein